MPLLFAILFSARTMCESTRTDTVVSYSMIMMCSPWVSFLRYYTDVIPLSFKKIAVNCYSFGDKRR